MIEDGWTEAAGAGQALLRAVMDWAVAIDPSGQVVSVITGALPSDANLELLVSPQDRADVRRAIEAAGEGSDSILVASVEFPLRGAAVLYVVAPPQPAGDGSVVLAARATDAADGLVDDALEALRTSKRRFRTLLEHAPEAIVILDVERGCYVDVNLMAEELYGLPREVLRDRNPVALSPPTQPDGRDSGVAATEYIEAALNGETPVFEWTHLHADGREIPVEVRLVRLPDPHRQLVRGSLLDISARKEAERDRERLRRHLVEAQKMEALGQLTGGVAHDFNNLLTVVIGNLELARLEAGRPLPADSPIEQSMAACQRAASLTQRLLAFGRRQALQPRRVNLNALIDGMHTLLCQAVGETIDIEEILDPDLADCEIDPGQMENAILNLVLNARDAMPEGGRVVIRTRNLRAADGRRASRAASRRVQLSIFDTGVGMSEDVRSQVLEPFFTTKGIGEGSGLGLSTVYGFVNQSHGSLDIHSDVGEGTRVDIELPAVDRARTANGTRARRRLSAVKGTGQLVLIVEDDEHVRRLSRRLIRSLGYRTVEAADAADALRCLAQHDDVELLFTDIVLPGGTSGVELVRQARQRHAALPAVYASGYTRDELPASSDGIELVRKPFTGPQLAEYFARALASVSEVAGESE